MHFAYSPHYGIDIGPHVFPTQKYRLVVERLLDRAVIQRTDLVEPSPASWDELALVHTHEYLARLRDGTMTPEDVAQLELPWSHAMVEGFRVMVQGTIDAALIACGRDLGSQKREVRSQKSEVGSISDFRPQTSDFHVVCHIGGGLHHAFPNHGEGFCPFNDV